VNMASCPRPVQWLLQYCSSLHLGAACALSVDSKVNSKMLPVG